MTNEKQSNGLTKEKKTHRAKRRRSKRERERVKREGGVGGWRSAVGDGIFDVVAAARVPIAAARRVDRERGGIFYPSAPTTVRRGRAAGFSPDRERGVVPPRARPKPPSRTSHRGIKTGDDL